MRLAQGSQSAYKRSSHRNGVSHHQSHQAGIHIIPDEERRNRYHGGREHEETAEEFQADREPSIDRHGRHVTSLISINASFVVSDEPRGLVEALRKLSRIPRQQIS